MEAGLELMFDVLSNGTRRHIISTMSPGREAGFTQIMRGIGLDPTSQTGSFSYHLSKLLESGIIRRTRQGYSLTELGKKASELLVALDRSEGGGSPVEGDLGNGLEITPMGEVELMEVAQGIFSREDRKSRKRHQKTRQALGTKDVSEHMEKWAQKHRHWVFGILNPTPDRVDRPDAWASRSISLVAKKQGRVAGCILASQQPAKKLPGLGWGRHLQHADRATQIERLLSRSTAGVIDMIWVDPDQDYDFVREALVSRILAEFKDRDSIFVEIERGFESSRESQQFESGMNMLGFRTTLRQHRIFMRRNL